MDNRKIVARNRNGSETRKDITPRSWPLARLAVPIVGGTLATTEEKTKGVEHGVIRQTGHDCHEHGSQNRCKVALQVKRQGCQLNDTGPHGKRRIKAERAKQHNIREPKRKNVPKSGINTEQKKNKTGGRTMAATIATSGQSAKLKSPSESNCAETMSEI